MTTPPSIWASTSRARAAPPKWHVYEINVQVGWNEQRRTVGVSTLRTISETAQQEEARRP